MTVEILTDYLHLLSKCKKVNKKVVCKDKWSVKIGTFIHFLMRLSLRKEVYIITNDNIIQKRGRRGGDRMVVGFTTTCVISAYHH